LLSWGIELSSPATGAHVLEAIGRRPRLAEDKIAKLRRLLRRADPNEMYLSLVAAGWESPASVLTGHAHQRDAVEWQYSQFSALPLLDRSMLLDQLTYLPDDLLAKVDRASMAVSLEARVPLLDHRIVEFGWTLPSSMKVRKGKGKHILRQVLHRYVPQHLLGTAKVGFSVPLDDWLRGPLRSWAEDLFQGAEPPVNRLELLAIWRRFKDGEPGLALGLWAAAMFEAWRLQWRPLV
jgi:asparagine synthase (glutamine-hydrolysing)